LLLITLIVAVRAPHTLYRVGSFRTQKRINVGIYQGDLMKISMLFFSLMLCGSAASAQWVPTDGIYGGEVALVVASGNCVYAQTWEGVVRSTNGGTTWTLTSLNGRYISSLAVNGRYVFAVQREYYDSLRTNGVYVSSDSGSTWTQTLNLPNVLSLAAGGSYAFAGNDSCVYRSTNNGETWARTTLNQRNLNVYSLTVSGSYVYAATSNGGYRSSNYGTSWTQTSSGGMLAGIGGTVFIPTSVGLYRSVNYGTDYTLTSLTGVVSLLAVNGTELFAVTTPGGAYEEIYRSTNNGVDWVRAAQTTYKNTAIAFNGTSVFSGTSRGVYRSTDGGTTWAQTACNFRNVKPLTANGSNIFALGSTICIAANGGSTWTPIPGPPAPVKSIAAAGSYIFAGTHDQGAYRSSNGGRG
jgi:hypothetical protein